MKPRLSSQTSFLLRAAGALAVFLALWWFLLLPPLLGWERISTDLLLSLFPDAPLQTGATIDGAGTWVLQAPARVRGVTRNIRLELPPRLPIQLTVGLPLFWAILAAAPRTPRPWRALLAGSAALLALPPLGLIAYAAHVVQLYVFPDAPIVMARTIAGIDYVASTVAPFIAPVLLAVGLHPALAARILGETPGGSLAASRTR